MRGVRVREARDDLAEEDRPQVGELRDRGQAQDNIGEDDRRRG